MLLCPYGLAATILYKLLMLHVRGTYSTTIVCFVCFTVDFSYQRHIIY